MQITVLETSSSTGGVALADQDGLVFSQILSAERKHARDLFPILQELHDRAGWSPRKTELVLVSLGPGSYTGLRVGVMAAKTIAYATGAAVVGVDTMAVLAEGAPGASPRVFTTVDAQQNQVYVAEFRRSEAGGRLVQAGETQIVRAADFAPTVPAGSFVTGPAAFRLCELTSPDVHFAPPEMREPSLEMLFRVGWREYVSGRRDDLWTLEPAYLRVSSAEAKWAARTQDPGPGR